MEDLIKCCLTPQLEVKLYSFDEFKAIVYLGYSEDTECQTLASVLVRMGDYIHKGHDKLTLVLESNEIRYDGDTFEVISQIKPFVFTSKSIKKVYKQLIWM